MSLEQVALVELNGNSSDGVLYPDLSADDESGLTQVSSLCMNCREQGETKFLFIQIPFFREIILSSFSCIHCGYNNNEIQSAGAIQEKGVSWSLKVTMLEDLNRQVIRTESASISIPALQFEIPAVSQKGTLSTIEGILQRAIEGLNQEQPIRRALEPELADKIDSFIEKLKELLLVKTPFVLQLDDPSGNSFIENPVAPKADPNLSRSYFMRTLEQDQVLGLQPPASSDGAASEKGLANPGALDLNNEVMTFNTNCPNCNSPCDTNMKVVNIPYFKEVIIMATSCDRCGQRTNEVKSGSGFEPNGRKLTLRVENPVDLSRDVLKSETCAVQIPELELESEGISISGKFTTVEGLLLDLKKVMVDANPFIQGDSAKSLKLKKFGVDLQDLADGKRPFTLILDDPNANSYVQDIYLPEKDPRLSKEDYERSYEQNEMLGLNDMKTENYT